jgi:hypothetical protein
VDWGSDVRDGPDDDVGRQVISWNTFPWGVEATEWQFVPSRDTWGHFSITWEYGRGPHFHPDTGNALPPGASVAGMLRNTLCCGRSLLALWRLCADRVRVSQQLVWLEPPRRPWMAGQNVPQPRDVIVALRNAAGPGGRGATEGEGPAWSHQWEVRGHWHRFRVGPGRAELVTRWVKEYRKGPPDKPFVPPLRRDYGVTR